MVIVLICLNGSFKDQVMGENASKECIIGPEKMVRYWGRNKADMSDRGGCRYREENLR